MTQTTTYSRLLVLILLFCIATAGYTQGWKKEYGTSANKDYFRDIKMAQDGGFMLSGLKDSILSV